MGHSWQPEKSCAVPWSRLLETCCATGQSLATWATTGNSLDNLSNHVQRHGGDYHTHAEQLRQSLGTVGNSPGQLWATCAIMGSAMMTAATSMLSNLGNPWQPGQMWAKPWATVGNRVQCHGDGCHKFAEQPEQSSATWATVGDHLGISE